MANAGEKSEMSRIEIEGLLPEGKFVTQQRYTAEQEREMRYIAREVARAVMRKLKPDLVDQVEIKKVA